MVPGAIFLFYISIYQKYFLDNINSSAKWQVTMTLAYEPVSKSPSEAKGHVGIYKAVNGYDEEKLFAIRDCPKPSDKRNPWEFVVVAKASCLKGLLEELRNEKDIVAVLPEFFALKDLRK